ncbi:MAG TPA: hypothetical protein VLT36_22735 [Candidatus Dormibacteraeota bacterium]|nr:hypothetical protein [Candidatus Dormibacteraeota bacterium]
MRDVVLRARPGVWPEAAGKEFADSGGMQTACHTLTRDGEDIFVAVPDNRTAQLYEYLRGFGLRFTIECRGFCEDNVFCFGEGENLERLRDIVGSFKF